MARDVDKLPYRPTAEAFLRDNRGNLVAFIKSKNALVDGQPQRFLKVPGGGIDPGEDPKTGLKRELMEETGVTPRNLRLVKDVKWDWPESWVSNEKQRKRYNQFRGEHSHVYTGDVGKVQAPTSQEGDAWAEVPSLDPEIARDQLAGSIDPSHPEFQHPNFTPYKQAQLAAILAMMSKRAKVELDLKVGDIVLTGRFKNRRQVVRELGTDELGQPTINGQKLLTLRIEKALPERLHSKETRMDKQAFADGYMAKSAVEEEDSLRSELDYSRDYNRRVARRGNYRSDYGSHPLATRARISARLRRDADMHPQTMKQVPGLPEPHEIVAKSPPGFMQSGEGAWMDSLNNAQMKFDEDVSVPLSDLKKPGILTKVKSLIEGSKAARLGPHGRFKAPSAKPKQPTK
jgi:putative (di)nucleoside polyphosphate hydrolase